MSDIVERLRDAHSFMGDPLLEEAAAEIERLREALREIAAMDGLSVVEYDRDKQQWSFQAIARAELAK